MGGKVVECEADWILQRGIEQGREQGIEQGIEQGKEQGKEQGHVQLIENLLNKNKTPAEIAEFCDFEIQEIENVQKRMLVNI